MLYEGNTALNTDPNIFQPDPALKIFPQETQKNKREKNHLKILRDKDNIFTFDNFVPFGYQAAILREMISRDYIKRGFIILPRRAGKTEIMVIYMILQSFKHALKETGPTLSYGLVYPDLQSGKLAAGDKLKQRTTGLPGVKYSENRGQVKYYLNGKKRSKIEVTIRIIGLQDMGKRRGAGYKGIICDERATLPIGFKPIINPMIANPDFPGRENKDAFLLYIGTPDEIGDFWNEYDDFKSRENSGDLRYYTYWSDYYNLKHISEEDAQQQLLDYGEEHFNIEYGCKRGQVTGARIFAEQCFNVQDQKRVLDIPYNAAQKKWLAVDVGSSKRDFFASWVIQANFLANQWQFVDYKQIASATPDKVHEWVQSRKHRIGQIIAPFDADRGEPSAREELENLFPQAAVTIAPKVEKQSRITSAKRLFNYSTFDSQNTVVGWNCLKNYSRMKDKTRQIYLLDPKHDKYSHGAEAFCYFAVAMDNGLVDVDMNRSNYADFMGGGRRKAFKAKDTLLLNEFIDKENNQHHNYNQ